MEQIVVYIPDYLSVYHMINKANIFGFEAKQSGAGIGAFTSGNDRMLFVPSSGHYIFVADEFDYYMDNDYDVIHSWLKKASDVDD